MTSELAFAALFDEWRGLGLEGSGFAKWEGAFEAIAAEQAQLRADRKWRTGGRTLLHALGLHHDEVRLCAGLAWLLTPDGWHGLGSSFLSALMVDLGLSAPEAADLASASIITEETSLDGSTRADIVIRLPRTGTSVLIEAKVWADEQPDQCRRLADLWGEEVPTLVFLTRSGRQPMTASDGDDWVATSWARVAELLRSVESEHWSSGAHELTETIETYGGKPSA